MWAMSSTKMPTVITFNENFSFVRETFRAHMYGGLSTVLHRHLDLSGGSDSPHEARHTPNGDDLTHATIVDFNS